MPFFLWLASHDPHRPYSAGAIDSPHRLEDAIVPPYLPAPLALVYVSGVFEILGGLGVIYPGTRRWAGYGLLALLIASFMSRARVFCQYLRYMTGIHLSPSTVQGLYARNGRGGVRDHLIDLLIREDLADEDRVVTPDSKPDTSIFESTE